MCHHHRRHEEREVERLAAPGPPSGSIRVGDADRERVAELLRNHAAAGRLDTHELEQRLERAYAARVGSDLHAVLADLPAEPAARSVPLRRTTTPTPVLPLAIGALIAVAAITSAWWLMWLIWPLVIVLGPRRHYRRMRV
jgi:Domain of unknown function (DUF1707)